MRLAASHIQNLTRVAASRMQIVPAWPPVVGICRRFYSCCMRLVHGIFYSDHISWLLLQRESHLYNKKYLDKRFALNKANLFFLLVGVFRAYEKI
jgi:hypothetical protein